MDYNKAQIAVEYFVKERLLPKIEKRYNMIDEKFKGKKKKPTNIVKLFPKL